MAKTIKKNFAICLALADREESILEFHKKHLTEYLWPRTLDEFKELIEDQCLYEVIEKTGGRNELIGICYIKSGMEPGTTIERDEFGGIYILPEYNGFGLASALGILAISQHYVYSTPSGRMIAHVHESNTLPRGLLKNQLGFSMVGQEIPPTDAVPPSMARNSKGEVVGDLFQFNQHKLSDFAQWLEDFDGTISGKTCVKSDLLIDMAISKFMDNAIKSLRDLAK